MKNVNKGAILILKKGKIVKFFKTWSKGEEAKVAISWKRKGETKKIVKAYKQTKERVALVICCEAVMKYWPGFDPQLHEMAMTGGHNHDIEVKKCKKKS